MKVGQESPLAVSWSGLVFVQVLAGSFNGEGVHLECGRDGIEGALAQKAGAQGVLGCGLYEVLNLLLG